MHSYFLFTTIVASSSMLTSPERRYNQRWSPWFQASKYGPLFKQYHCPQKKKIQMEKCTRKNIILLLRKKVSIWTHSYSIWAQNISSHSDTNLNTKWHWNITLIVFHKCKTTRQDQAFNLSEIRVFHPRWKPFIFLTIFLYEADNCFLLLLIKGTPPEPMLFDLV